MSKRRKSIRMKLMLPIYVLFVVFCFSNYLTLFTIYQSRDTMKEIRDVQTMQIELADELQLNVVQVQQFLTDISATRGQNGLDDGFEVAAEHAARVRELITELQGLFPERVQNLESLRTDFETYYACGIEMATAYVASGPAGGNQLMAEFDAAAATLTEGVETYVTLSREGMEAAISSLNRKTLTSIFIDYTAPVVALILLLIAGHSTTKNLSRPIQIIQNAAQRLRQGDLNTKVEFTSDDEIGGLADDLQDTFATLQLYIGQIRDCLSQVSTGDLTVEVPTDFRGDFIQIGNSLNQLVSTLHDTINQISMSSSYVSTGAGQVAQSSQQLSQNTERQAGLMKELMDGLNTATIQTEADGENANQVAQLSQQAGQQVASSNQSMQEMLQAMEEINRTSTEINKVIKTIEDIAFQTNILALNAAVEAARAGTAGKGFAVVADEVRNLASKSAEAAQSTTTLIEASSQAVARGVKISQETAQALVVVSESTDQIIEVIKKITDSTEIQSRAFELIDHSAQQISGMVQDTAAHAEESAAASEELSSQSTAMQDMVEQFQLHHG